MSKRTYKESFDDRFKNPEDITKQLNATPKKLKKQLLGDNSGQRLLDIPIIILLEDKVLVTKKTEI